VSGGEVGEPHGAPRKQEGGRGTSEGGGQAPQNGGEG